MGLIFITVLVITAIVLIIIRFKEQIDFWSWRVKELRKSWTPDTPIDLRLNFNVTDDSWILQIRKKCWRIFKDTGWKNVNYYDEHTLRYHIWWPADTDALSEERTLRSLIHTYGDLDGYYGISESYEILRRHQDACKSLKRKVQYG